MGERGSLPKLYGVRTGHRRPPEVLRARPIPPAKPVWVAADGVLSSLWDSVVAEFGPLGVLSRVDGPMLQAFVAEYRIWLDARERIAADGIVSPGRTGELVRHPAVNILHSATSRLESLAKALALSPASRLRLPPPPEPEYDDGILD